MQGDDPTGHRPGGPAPGEPGAGADTVLAALAHRLRARSERQQLLTERLRSGELRPGALADLAELAAAARRGVRDGDHVLVMAGADVPGRGNGGGPVPLGQSLSTAVAASEAASRTVVPPTPSVSLVPSCAPVFGQILAELLAHATAATGPGERLELHTRWAPDGGLVLELLSPRPVPTRTPIDDLDRMLAAGRPDGPVAPQEIGLYLAARLARAVGGRLGVRGSPGVLSAPGPSPVAVLQMPPSAFAGAWSGDDADAPEPSSGPGVEAAAEPLTSAVPSAPEPSVPPWPPLAEAASANVAAPDPGPPPGPQDGPSGPNPIARLPVPPLPQSPPPLPVRSSPGMQTPPGASPSPGTFPASGPGPHLPGSQQPGSNQPGVNQPGVNQPGASQPGMSQPGASQPGASQPGMSQPGASQPGPNQPGPNQPGPNQPGTPGTNPPGPQSWPAPPPGPDQPWPARPSGAGPPEDVSPVTEALPVSGSTPPVELFGPFDSEVPVPVDDLDGTPIFAAVASAWFRDPNTPPNGALSGGPPDGTNGRRPGEEPPNWTTLGDAEFNAARSRADRPMEPSVNANGLPMRRPGQQMVPPSRRENPSTPQRPGSSAERQPDRVRNRLASYQRGLREGRHRAAEEHSGSSADGGDARNLDGAAPHGRNGHATG